MRHVGRATAENSGTSESPTAALSRPRSTGGSGRILSPPSEFRSDVLAEFPKGLVCVSGLWSVWRSASVAASTLRRAFDIPDPLRPPIATSSVCFTTAGAGRTPAVPRTPTSSSDASDAADAHDEPELQSDTGAPVTHDSAVNSGSAADTGCAESAERHAAERRCDAGSRKAHGRPAPARTGCGYASDGCRGQRFHQSAGQRHAAALESRAVLARQPRADRDPRGARGPGQAGADLGAILSTLDSDGQCAFIDRATCLTACGLVATRAVRCVLPIPTAPLSCSTSVESARRPAVDAPLPLPVPYSALV